ncbi:MAG: AAA family ATPase [Streptosporangiales bacterium]|nr:AAA family ATPase [Streptosporangiales bacterium]
MDQAVATVADRLVESPLSEAARTEVRAALRGATESPGPRRRPDPAPVLLGPVTVRGFRGIGAEATLPLRAAPGLTLVTGRNGSGKSSFAEAIEIALTGRSSRSTGRSAIWRDGLRNLHADEPSEVVVRLRIADDSGPARLICRDLAGEPRTTVARDGEGEIPAEALGWGPAMATFRPFLPYAELGQMMSGQPSGLHDALASILGTDVLGAAEERLGESERELREALRADDRVRDGLIAELRDSPDGRAARAITLLRDRFADPAAVRELSVEEAGGAPDGALLALAGPDAPAVAEAAAELRGATMQLGLLAGTKAERAHHLAGLLERAIGHFEHGPGEGRCPVCGERDALDDVWAEDVRTELAALRGLAEPAEAAHERVRLAVRRAHDLLGAPPDALPEGSSVRAAWEKWAAGRSLTDPEELAGHLERSFPPLEAAVRAARTEAAAAMEEAEAAWLPLAARLAGWAAGADAAGRAAARLPAVQAAWQWLTAEAQDLRNERLRPLADRATEIWRRLRHESNVELGPIRLQGVRNRRRVDFDVLVDAAGSAALSVMSQGELHALALSVFLPRATSADSPFRFVVIDDPVQSMDPAKVDGLAEVLAAAAEDRQVIVFTHDTRLPEAVRRLRLPATVFEVIRGEGSVVLVDEADDPVRRALRDAE